MMKIVTLLFGLVVACLAADTSLNLAKGLTLAASSSGFTVAGEASRSSFTFVMGTMAELDVNGKVLRNCTYGSATFGSFSDSSAYISTSLNVPITILDISLQLTYTGELSWDIYIFTAESSFTWGNETIPCPSGAIKVVPTVTWITPSVGATNFAVYGSASWDISTLDLAAALQSGINYSPVDSNGAQIGANVGIKGGIGLYFSFPGAVKYQVGSVVTGWGKMKYSMTNPELSESGSANWEVEFDSVAQTMSFDPVVHVTGDAKSLVYSFSLIFLVLAFIKLF